MSGMTMMREQVMELLPCRDPFLLIDELSGLVPGESAVGTWYVRPELDVLGGHFPGDPTLPGIYTLEMSGQVGRVLLACASEQTGVPPVFLGVDRSRYHRRVRPGDVLTANCRVIGADREREQYTVRSEVCANGELAAEIELVLGKHALSAPEGTPEEALPPELSALEGKRALSNQDILAFTRIREPFRMVDEITELVPGSYAVGRKYVDPAIPALKGCCPEEPALPATYLIEATGQLGGLSVAASPEFADKRSLLLGVNKARIYRTVRPGETLELYSHIAKIRRDKFIITFVTQAFVGGQLAAETEIAIAMR